MDELFFSGNRVEYDESGLYPPLHPRCACAVRYIEVEAPRFSSESKVEDIQILEYNQNELGQTVFPEGDIADFVIENANPGTSITQERINIVNTLSSVPKKVLDAINDGTRIIVGQRSSSGYDYDNDILHIARGASSEDVAHELGHLIDKKLVSRKKADLLIRKAVAGLSVSDVIPAVYYDAIGNPIIIYLVRSNRLVSEYQGRIYVQNSGQAADSNGNIRIDLLKEFVSEIFRRYLPQKQD